VVSGSGKDLNFYIKNLRKNICKRIKIYWKGFIKSPVLNKNKSWKSKTFNARVCLKKVEPPTKSKYY
jgi:hypothetical protein